MTFKLFLMNAFLLIYSAIFAQTTVSSFDKMAFYNVFASNNLESIETQLKLIRSSGIPEKIAYEGALLMKKAGVVRNPKDKLSLFKEGHEKLEHAIAADNSNVEYHFLRLMIQEKAPGILNYNDQIPFDTQLLKNSYKKLPMPALHAIKEYSKTSKYVKPEDFQ